MNDEYEALITEAFFQTDPEEEKYLKDQENKRRDESYLDCRFD
jgi:hypothetical protein